MNDAFKAWLSEGNPDSNWEQLIDEYENSLLNLKRVLQWMDAAYARGYNDAKNTVQ
jgi:hypothetical protein